MTKSKTTPQFIITLTMLCCFAALSYAQATQPAPETYKEVAFNRKEVMIKMRDGVKLHTIILAPENSSESLPFLMMRTPYGVQSADSKTINQAQKELVADGYIFVYQDIRGRHKSQGQFVMNRPLRTDKNNPKAIDETTDTYDTIEWVLKNIPNNNGRVGIMGISYPGWTSVMGVLDPHPAMKASSPQAAMGDTWMGDDFFHNGAFRLSYGFEYVYSMEISKRGKEFHKAGIDTYDWYLGLGALSNANDKYFHGKLPTWQNFIAHPTYDDFWQAKALDRLARKPTIPMLHIAGWFDQEDFYGAVNTYLAFEKNDTDNLNTIVIGPWNHGGWARTDGSSLGQLSFASATGKYYRANIQAPFFAYHLKGKGNFKPAEVTTFETGSNTWKNYEAWPPKENYAARNLYFHSNGRLSFDAPTAAGNNENDSYISDPKNPVPYRPRPVQPTYSQGSQWFVWLTQDQRFVKDRADVLKWQTAVLTEDITISGQIFAQLFASTSGTDSDWIVKLIDVYPDNFSQEQAMNGYQQMIASEILRGRYRNSFTNPAPVQPDEVNSYKCDLRWADHTFKKGHRIMVQVQSTWFPLYDRNPQKYVENIFKATEADYQAATQRIFRSPQYPSHIILPLRTQ